MNICIVCASICVIMNIEIIWIYNGNYVELRYVLAVVFIMECVNNVLIIIIDRSRQCK